MFLTQTMVFFFYFVYIVETTDLPTTRETLAPVVYQDCQDALEKGQTTSGVYTVEPYGVEQFDAYCNMSTEEGYIVSVSRFVLL